MQNLILGAEIQIGQARAEVLFHEFRSGGYVQRPKYTASWMAMTNRQAWRNTHPQYQIEMLKTRYQTMQQLRDQRELPKYLDVARVQWSPEEMISAYKPQTRGMKNCA